MEQKNASFNTSIYVEGFFAANKNTPAKKTAYSTMRQAGFLKKQVVWKKAIVERIIPSNTRMMVLINCPQIILQDQ